MLGCAAVPAARQVEEMRLSAFHFLSFCCFVIASEAKQSSAAMPFWIASSLRSSQ
jgi:hypothetical protein